MGIYVKIVTWLTPGELTQSTIMVHIAVAHTVFNCLNTFIFLPMINGIESLLMKIMPVTEEESEQKPVVLEEHLLDTPVIALEQAKREIIRMAEKSLKAIRQAIDGLTTDNPERIAKARRTEDQIDEYQHEITSYLVVLSQRQLNEDVSTELPVLLHMVNDLERVGDHAVNIAELAERKIEYKLPFSEIAQRESKQMVIEVYLMFDSIITALKENDPQAARTALVSESKLNKMQLDLRRNHVRRMTEGSCTAQSGLIFIDLVDNIEKIGDHLTNIAQSVMGGLHWDKINGNALSGEFGAIKLD
jgi:phosphate:Na+ symporter